MRPRNTLLASLALGLTTLCLAAPAAEAQYELVWEVRYDGPEVVGDSSRDYVTDMVVRDSYVYVTGYEHNYGSDWATVKYDYAGQELWVSRYEEGNGQPKAMAVDAAGNVYVTGYSNAGNDLDVFTFKYSPDGVLLWERNYNSPGGNNTPSDMALDASGNIYIAGASLITGPQNFDLLLLKYDSEGVLLWDRTLDNGDGQLDSGYKVAIDPDGNALVAGFTEPAAYLVKYSPTGDLLWEREHESYAPWDQWKRVETDATGNIYVLGEISPGSQPKHLWTTKYDPDGNILWERTYTGTHSYDCYAGGLALMPDGGVVISGQSWDEPFNISIVTIRYAPDGTQLWQRLETAGYAHASGDDVAVDAEGRIYVTGYGYDYSYWEDIITLGYSPDGDLLWTQIYAGQDYESQSDYPHAIAVDEAANVFVAAHSWGDDSNDFTTIRYGQACEGDCNADATVDSQDLAALLVAWDNAGGPEDINGDGIVDSADLSVVLASWGPCPWGSDQRRISWGVKPVGGTVAVRSVVPLEDPDSGTGIGVKAAVTASKVLALTGIDLLADAKLLEQAKADFNERTEGFTYE